MPRPRVIVTLSEGSMPDAIDVDDAVQVVVIDFTEVRESFRSRDLKYATEMLGWAVMWGAQDVVNDIMAIAKEEGIIV